MPAARTASATPATSGASGPTTTRSAPTRAASAATSAGSAGGHCVQLGDLADAWVAGGSVQFAHFGVTVQRPG